MSYGTLREKLENMAMFQMLTILLLFQPQSELKQENLNALVGKWDGTLTYTNYGDDETRVTLETRMEATFEWKKERIKFKLFYTEPNGEVKTGGQSLGLGKKSGTIFYNKTYEVVESEVKAEEKWSITIQKEGKDNNRNSTIRHIIELNDDELTIRKMVRYEGTEIFFERNIHSFQR